MDGQSLRVLIADDHTLFRKGVRSLLATVEGIDVIAEAADARQAIDLTHQLGPDLVLMDLQMPAGGGLAAIRAIIGTNPDANVLVMTMFEDDDSVFAAMRAGARGYVLKDMDADDLTRAIVAVGRGEAIFSPGIAVRMARFFADRPASRSPFPELTDSERKVLRLMATGAGNNAIANQLSFSPKTVRNYISNIFRKLQVADRSHAIVLARQAGIQDEQL
jgi:DNA-binding NarL/FixJ family response regulator